MKRKLSGASKQKADAQVPAVVEIPDATVGTWRGERYLAPIIACVLASILLLWGLTNTYLWQDEANTAVLATRLLKFGRPLTYDGVNFISVDDLSIDDEATIDQRTKDPKAVIDYYVARHTIKPDTSWIYHPWGQFLVAGASLKLLGQTTFAARFPFALAGILTVLLLYEWVRRYFGSPLMAQLAVALLLCNAYWILHGRQCRYYALTSLFLVVTVIAYSYWQRGGRWGAVAFVAAAWCWFQVDYGTLWPVLGVLFVDALLSARRNFWRTLLVGAALAAALAPFVYYFKLWGRTAAHHEPWLSLFNGHLYDINEYVMPVVLLMAAVGLVAWRWTRLPSLERRLVAVACGILGALMFWVPSVSPDKFLRYTIMAAPVGCALTAWVVVRGCHFRATSAWIATAVIALTPWFSMPVRAFNPAPFQVRESEGLRAELSILWTEVFVSRPDPNRLVIDWLKEHAKPTDEILINYEDLPLMFYLPNPIRGGIAAFRAEDDAKHPPEFLVIRHSVGFVHWPVFQREADRYHWKEVGLNAPDVPWGNFPDPLVQNLDFDTSKRIFLAQRVPEEVSVPH